jgi:hypothetical protein
MNIAGKKGRRNKYRRDIGHGDNDLGISLMIFTSDLRFGDHCFPLTFNYVLCREIMQA